MGSSWSLLASKNQATSRLSRSFSHVRPVLLPQSALHSKRAAFLACMGHTFNPLSKLSTRKDVRSTMRWLVAVEPHNGHLQAGTSRKSSQGAWAGRRGQSRPSTRSLTRSYRVTQVVLSRPLADFEVRALGHVAARGVGNLAQRFGMCNAPQHLERHPQLLRAYKHAALSAPTSPGGRHKHCSPTCRGSWLGC